MRILVIEDDPRMAGLLDQGLREEGFQVTVLSNGSDGLDMARHGDFEVIILDVMLPGMDGFEVARKLRLAGRKTPLIMLTARDSSADIIRGLDCGADDYLTKPFAFGELLARVRAAGRRGPQTKGVLMQEGTLSVDTASRDVRVAGQLVALTRTEYSILLLLLRRAGQVVTRETILEQVWGFDRDVESNTLDAFMRLLRSKVDMDATQRLIHTVRGVGYQLRSVEPC